MSRTSASPLAKLNVPLILLWLASIIVAVAGYVLMTSSNANQAQLYTSQTGDYAKLFAAQSGSTIGGLLIGVGVLGVLLALAAQAIARTRTVALAPVAPGESDLAFDDQSFSIETVYPAYPAAGSHAQPTDATPTDTSAAAHVDAGEGRTAPADADADQHVHPTLNSDENEQETVPAR